MMKKCWIVLNGGLFLVVLSLFFSPTAASRKAASAGKNLAHAKAKSPKTSRGAAVAYGTPAALPDLETACDRIVAADIFNQVRSPLANVRGGRGDLVLMGTFKIGNLEGAIIQMKANNRQYNPFLAQAMRAQGAPPGAPSGGMPPGGAPGFGRNWTPQGPGGGNIGIAKQYVRVGETLSNGYMLVEISRTRAVLIRGNDKMELELQDPSKNRTSTTASAPKLNASQQLQQVQMTMQGQMMRTMMMMQQNMQNGAPPGRGGNRGGSRGGRR